MSLDPFSVRRRLGTAARVADLDALRTVRRTLLPLPLVDRAERIETDVFGELRKRPVAALRGKRIGVVACAPAHGASAVALVGVVRALEEAGIEPDAIAASGWPAVWAAMWAAGADSRHIAYNALCWRPQDHVGRPRFAMAATRGFAGLPTAAALEALFDRSAWRTSCGAADIPLHTPVYELDRERLLWFGSDETPELTLGELARIAVARPTRGDAVRIEGELCVDGGFVDAFPAEPLIADGGFDRVFALDFAAPGAESGRSGGVSAAQREELASRSRRRLGESLTAIGPIPAHGDDPYSTYIDRRRWPELMRSGYQTAVEALAPFRRRAARGKAG